MSLSHWVGVAADTSRAGSVARGMPQEAANTHTMNRDLTNPAVVELDASSFDLIIQEGVVLVDFWAPWCGPCRMQTPILQKLARRFGAQATIAKVNVDDAPRLAERFGIRGIPTLILFRTGQLWHQFVGVQPEGILAKAILVAVGPEPSQPHPL